MRLDIQAGLCQRLEEKTKLDQQVWGLGVWTCVIT